MRRALRGFSFFETILYLALFSLLAVGLFHFSFDVLDLGTKDRTSRQVFSDARFVADRIRYFIRNSSGIDTDASVWDDANGRIVLGEVGSSDTMTITTSNGRVMLTETGQSEVALHSSTSKVRSLTFQRYGLQTDGSEYIGFLLVLESAASGSTLPAEYGAITTIQGGASIRNSGVGL